MDPRPHPAHGQSDDYISFWQHPFKFADFTPAQELSVLVACATTLPGTSAELDLSCPPSESLASSYDNIGIFVEPVDPVDPHTDATAATPSTTSASNYTPADVFPDAGQDYSYHSDLTDSASASGPGTPSSKEPFTSRLAKRSMSFTRSSSQRGRPPFRRDSRPPNLELPSGPTRRELSPLDIFPQQPSLTGPHTEPNLNELSFDWCSAPNPALLSPPASSTLEIRRKRSSSFRSHRAASVSGQPESTFLNVPDHSNKSGFTRRRSISVPSDPTSNFCPTNVSPVTRPRAFSNSRPRSPAVSLTTSPSVSSFEDPQDSNSSSGFPPFQLPPSHGVYNSYDTPSSYQPSPESPFLELDSLDIYTHGNSSASSIASQHSVHSQASLSPQLLLSEAVGSLLTTEQTGFDFNNDYLHSIPPLTHNVLYHDNGGGPTISITNTDDSSTHPDSTLTRASEADLDFFAPDYMGFLDPTIFDDGNDPGGQAPVSSIESAAASPADTLAYPVASPGDSEQSFSHFESPSPAALEYGNLSLPASIFPLNTFSDGQGGNIAHASASSQGETRADGTHPRMSATALHEMHGNPSNITETLDHGVRPRTQVATSIVHMLGAGLGTYPHCNNDTSTAEGPSRQTSRTSHHLGNMIHHANAAGVGTMASSGHVTNGPLHENQLFPHLHNGFDLLPPSPSTNSMTNPEASSSSLLRRSSRVSSDNNLDPQFEAKKWVYKILTESTSKDKALARVTERSRGMKWNLLRSVFDDASQRKVKSTPAGQQRAQDRRSRPPTFICILCQSKFTTNNNLQNHYRSHLRMDQYRCPRCGDYFRTEGIRKRHTESAQKCCRLDGPFP